MSINANSLPNQSTMAATDRLLGFAPETNAGFSIDYTVLAKKIIEEYTGSTVAGSAQTLQSAINALNSKMSSENGGVPQRIAGTVSSGSSFSVPLSNSFSANEGFALVSLNISGNASAGTALLYLGRGTNKYKDLLGSMDTSAYSASYVNPSWTIVNNSSSDMFYTVIMTK